MGMDRHPAMQAVHVFMAAADLIHHGGPDMNYMQKLEQLAQANMGGDANVKG